MRPIFIKSGSRGGAASPVTITAEGSGNGGDSAFADRKLLLHGAGANNSTTIVDSSQNNVALVRAGDTKISTSQSKYGGSSIVFDGTSDYFRLMHPDLVIGTGDYCVEGWFMVVAHKNSNTIFGNQNANADSQGLTFAINASGQCYIYSANNIQLTTVGTVTENQWVHIAQFRVSGVNKVAIGGTVDANTWASSADYVRTLWGIAVSAQEDANYLNAYVEDFRVTIGASPYSASFTPPAATFLDYIGRITGVITNSSAVTDFRVVAVDASTGREVGDVDTNASSFTIECDDAVPCVVTIYPQSSGDYATAPPYTYGSLVTPS
jgi:hypothetical protein